MNSEQANFASDFDLTRFLAQQQQTNGGANIAGSSSGGHMNPAGEGSSSQLDLQQLDNSQQRARRSATTHLQGRPDALMASTEQRNDDRPMMGLQQQQSVANAGNQVNFDALQQLLSMQMDGSHNQMQLQQLQQHTQHGGGQPANMAANAQALLEQQVRLNQLQQLQQLQNQIFQQQIELISGQTNMSPNVVENMHGSFRDPTSFHGLPTPANSTEIRAQPSSNFVSPMILQNYGTHPSQTPMTQFSSPNPMPQGPSSAPAHIAFSNNPPSLPSPADLDFDLEPLTSPWLGAYQGTEQSQVQPDSTASRINAQQKSGTKRTAPNSEDDLSASQARKRHSPAVTTTTGRPPRHAASGNARASGSASLTSTPAIRSRDDSRDSVADTPSPVDLSVSSSIAMPPPAPPTMQSQSVGSNQAYNPNLSPVTPASIMNLGSIGLNSGLSPPLNGNANSSREAGGSGTSSSSGKSKPTAKSKASSSAASSSKSSKKASTNSSMISPSLKPLLPGGLPPASAAHLALHPNYTHHLSGSAPALNISPSTPLPQPTLQVRKTSHKAAEQKRRDSLKTSFDDLRLLLPPIPLPTDDNYDGSPPLPGSMPPRGPPRGEIQGPNRAVSKLQLLRCGNDYIRQLLRMVGRRDDYIEGLKKEVTALRMLVADDPDKLDKLKEIVAMDLELELDASEANGPRLGGVMEGEEGEEEADE
ncbi:hypothetical protein SCHPADRAFT_931413 [Schizopora paradoxa]|uniref:BHLH domain-containing protein n=1 Tax=Schizopora paradoxa TaxID=27342 RepID=A0A0H2RB17_9AGAM|nr:hypothetical protein SCHPADRAFT_931413 [Schizopora paradoxa]